MINLTDERYARRMEYAAVLVVLIGLALRLAQASRTYLNPDELWNLYASLPSDWYRDIIVRFEHPPLLAVFLHGVLRISYSELAVRMLPVLTGSIFPWFVYRWLARVQNIGAGFMALLILTFSPNLISLSAQVRGYIPALFFAAWAMWLIELALETKSAPRLAPFAICLYLAILSEYSTAWFVGVVGIYSLMRGVNQHVSRSFWLAWGLIQAGAVLIYVILCRAAFAPGLSNMHGKEESYLKGAFPGVHQNPLTFAGVGTIKQFAYTFSSVPLGFIGALLFAVGLVALWRERRALAVAMPMGFLLGAAAAILRLHPYGRSRHTVIFSIFIAAGAAAGLEALMRKRPAGCAAAMIALIVCWPFLAEQDQNDISRKRHQLADMRAAVKQVHALLRPGDLVLTDHETALLLRYYLCGIQQIPERPLASSTREWQIDGIRTVWRRWDLAGLDGITDDMTVVRHEFSVPPGEVVWVLDGGFDVTVAAQLRGRDGGQTLASYHDLNGVLVAFQTPAEGTI